MLIDRGLDKRQRQVDKGSEQLVLMEDLNVILDLKLDRSGQDTSRLVQWGNSLFNLVAKYDLIN